MRSILATLLSLLTLLAADRAIAARRPEPPDRGQPGDVMIQAWLCDQAQRLDGRFFERARNAEEWNKARPRLREEFLYMLGLWPLPEKSVRLPAGSPLRKRMAP